MFTTVHFYYSCAPHTGTSKCTPSYAGVAAVFDAMNSSVTELVFSAGDNFLQNQTNPEASRASLLSLQQMLQTNTKLKTLSIESNWGPKWGHVSAAAAADQAALAIAVAKALNATPALTTLSLRDSGSLGAAAIGDALQTNTVLTTLDLTGTTDMDQQQSIGNAGATAVANALKVNTALATLKICMSSVGETGLTAFGEGLKVNTALTSLDVSRSYFRNPSVAGVFGSALASALTGENTALTSLNLDFSDVGDGNAFGRTLSEALVVNTALSSLSMYYVDIEPDGAVAIAGSLGTNTVLQTLTMSHANVGNSGGIAFGEALKKNTALTLLDLSNGNLGDAACAAIADSLKVNAVLADLSMNSNSITDKCAVDLAAAIGTNMGLEKLNLDDHADVKDDGALAIAVALQQNSGPLVEVQLGYAGGSACFSLFCNHRDRGIQNNRLVRLVDFLADTRKSHSGVTPFCTNLGTLAAPGSSGTLAEGNVGEEVAVEEEGGKEEEGGEGRRR